MEADIAMIFLFGGNFAPQNFAFCNGQILNISQNTALFSLLGTTYGGNGINTFALPDLRGRTAIHSGNGAAGPGLSSYALGQSGGVESVALTVNQLPSHSHRLQLSSGAGTTGIPDPGTYLAAGPSTGSGPNASQLHTYTTVAPDTTLGSSTVQSIGGGAVHTNIQPYLAVNYIIAIYGIFPTRN
jgi:microcystin-dependent protein